MKVILSIKPEFALKIFSGKKKYEFRRAIFKRPGITRVVVYASAPISKVIGEFEIDGIIHDDITKLWNQTSLHAGINEAYFRQYFEGKEAGYAICIKNIRQYENQLCIKEHFNLVPPQSYTYIKE